MPSPYTKSEYRGSTGTANEKRLTAAERASSAGFRVVERDEAAHSSAVRERLLAVRRAEIALRLAALDFVALDEVSQLVARLGG